MTPDEGLALDLKVLRWTILEGPEAGAEIPVEGDRTSIGGAEDNAIVLSDPTVSRHHAEVVSGPEGVLVRDLGSKNGTFVGDSRVKEAYLTPGARLRCGQTTLAFEVATDRVVVLPGRQERFGELYGRSTAMRQVFAVLERVAATEMTIVLRGETGTGKELAARALHEASPRASGPLVVLDCAALDRELVSAQLFGHEAGAYTGAVGARPGAFEQAHGGTLVLDEVGELPPELQPKLLRVLERREVQRLGAARATRVDVRLVAATHRDLAAMVTAGTFRQDLFYRLAQVTVALPPLRERAEDIAPLAEELASRVRSPGGSRRFSRAALERLAAWPFPGNVRELRNLVERALALSAGPEVTREELEGLLDPAAAVVIVPAASAAAPHIDVEPVGEIGPESLANAERGVIERALTKFEGNRTKTAAALGISETTLREKIRRYAIAVPRREP